MKWLWLYLFPFCLQAQSLKPGCYHNLKPTGPLVLDTGSYTFVGLAPTNLSKGKEKGMVWLDARKAKTLTLVGCRFEGKGSETGVLTNGNAQITQSTFTNMKIGIQVLAKAGRNRTLTISGNTFKNNRTAITFNRIGSTGTATVDFTLKCNHFEQTAAITGPDHIGLKIGEGVSFPFNRIGGDGSLGMNEVPPNSNYWPRVGTTLAATNFPGYTSILNESASQIDYWAYENEHVGKLVPTEVTSPSRLRRQQLSQVFTVTEQNIAQWCAEHSGIGSCSTYTTIEECTQNLLSNIACTGGNTWVMACTEGGVFDDVVFPVERPMPKDTSYQALVAVQEQLYGKEVFLGQSIPNPGYQKVTIPIFLPTTVKKAALQVTEMATGRVVQNIAIPTNGIRMQEINVQPWASGIYSYTLIMNGSETLPKPMKMVVVH